MKDSSVLRTVLFNALIILTILAIYLLFFPKKSYVKEKLEAEDPRVTETFESNINSMKVASINYFKDNDKDKVTLEELINKNLLTELKDSKNNACSKDSYVEKKDSSLIISLDCDDKKDKKEITLGINITGENCIYEYTKETKQYSDWSEWSEWSKEKVEKDELTNVEEKKETEIVGKETETKTREVSIDASFNWTSGSCPPGYTEVNGTCKTVVEGNSINASVQYSCPEGYTRSGEKCIGATTIDAGKRYYCPSSNSDISFTLTGDKCRTFYTRYAEKGSSGEYSCPNGYTLSGNKCYTTETYEEEVVSETEVTYYRYQKREKKESKIETIWSSKDNQDLIDKEYTMSKAITCED